MRRTTMRMMLAALLLAGSAPAQEGAAPPARRGAGAQRPRPGERVRRLANTDGPLGQLLGALTGEQPGNQPPLAIGKLNEGIAALVQPLLDEEGGLEYLRLRFDPAETNLARDTVHLVGAARLRRSGWSEEPTQIDADVRAQMQRLKDGRPKGLLDGELRFQTDVIALANRAMARLAGQLQRRAQQGSVRDGPLSSEEAYRRRMLEKLEATPPLRTMDDVIDLVLTFSGLRLSAANDRVAELKAQLDQPPDERTRQSVEQDLAAARAERDQMLDIRPKVERDATGHAVALRLDIDRSQMGEATRIERLNIDITAAKVSIRLVGSTLQGMELYAISKPFILNTLSRVQARDPDTLRLGRGMFRGYLDSLGGAQDKSEAETLPPPAAP